jgi:hypothetical protein
VLDVVQFAERDRGAAAGEGAALISQGGGAADRDRPGVAGPADVQDAAGTTKDDRQDLRVAGQPADRGGIQG